MMTPITAIVLTRNEEENLPDCLSSLAWADEILVVDSSSTDRTVEIAQAAGARVVLHAFVNFAEQRNFAQAQARHDWVLFIDADERVSDELREEIRGLAASDRLSAYNAYHIQRIHLFSGHWFPELGQRKVTPRLRVSIRRLEVPRLFDRTEAMWERPLHEVVHIPEPHAVLDGVIYHHAASNLSVAFESFNDYTDREAAHLHRQRGSRRVSVLEAILRGARTFLYTYLVWGWWRRGQLGLLQAILLGYTKFINYAKLSERIRIQNGDGIWTDRDRKLLERDPG